MRLVCRCTGRWHMCRMTAPTMARRSAMGLQCPELPMTSSMAPLLPPLPPRRRPTLPCRRVRNKKKKRENRNIFYLQCVAKNDMSALSDCVCRFIHFPGNTVTVVAPTENGQSGDYKEFVSFLAPFWALFSLQFATHIFFPASPEP